MIDLIHAHWFPLTSQGNIYSLSTLYSQKGSNKVLVASLKRKIYSFEFHQHSKWRLKPILKELVFTYIPSGADIISIDSYNKSEEGDEFVIGITIMKPSGESSVERYLNIYTENLGEGDENYSIETIAQNCLMVELSYTPYLLYHTLIVHSSQNEIVWLISGSDNNIHMIREDKLNHSYKESPIENYFPELTDLNAIALWIDIIYYENYQWRLTGVSCECGLFKLSKVKTNTLEIIQTWALRYDNPVNCVKIFPYKNIVKPPDFLKTNIDSEKQLFNVLITTGNMAVIFQDVVNKNLDSDILLNINESDCILCCCIADINMDGKNEILLGTYNKEVNIFNFVEGSWKLIDKKLFDAPIHSLCYIDLVGDGIKSLVVLTQRSVHILQHNSKQTIEIWKERFSKLLLTINNA